MGGRTFLAEGTVWAKPERGRRGGCVERVLVSGMVEPGVGRGVRS